MNIKIDLDGTGTILNFPIELNMDQFCYDIQTFNRALENQEFEVARDLIATLLIDQTDVCGQIIGGMKKHWEGKLKEAMFIADDERRRV